MTLIGFGFEQKESRIKKRYQILEINKLLLNHFKAYILSENKKLNFLIFQANLQSQKGYEEDSLIYFWITQSP